MNSVDLNKLVTNIITSINDYQHSTSIKPETLTGKVNEFINNNPIPVLEQKHIQCLLEKISDLKSKDASCQELATLIAGLAKTISEPEKKDELSANQSDNNRLVQAENILKGAFKTFRGQLDEEQLKKFIGTTTEKERVAILTKLIMQDKPALIKHLTYDFEKFQIKNTEDRSELARLISSTASLNAFIDKKKFKLPSTDDSYLNQFAESLIENIKTEEIRFEMAKIIASEHPGAICNTLGAYQLTVQHRQEIACLLAENFIVVLRNKLVNFEFSEEERFAVVKSIAEKIKDPAILLHSIRNFNLSAEQRLNIALIVYARVGLAIVDLKECLQTLDLPEEGRFKLAQLHVTMDPISTIADLNEYELTNKAEIFYTALRLFPDEASMLISIYEPGLTPVPKGLEEWEKRISHSDNQTVKTWWRAFKIICRPFSDHDMRSVLPYIELIFKCENPSIRYFLSTAIARYKIPKQPTVEGDNAKLFNLVLDPFLKNVKIDTAEISKFWKILGGNEYREASVATLEKIIKGLFNLLECDCFAAQEKQELLKHVFDNHAKIPVHDALQMLDAIIMSKNTQLLKVESQIEKETEQKGSAAKNLSKLKHPIDLEGTLKEIFKILVGLESGKEFAKKYEQTIGKSRNPMALFIYAANLKALPQAEQEKTLKSLKEFTESVLEGTYFEQRYQVEVGSHLAQVFEGNAALAKNWQSGAKQPVGMLYDEVSEGVTKSSSNESAFQQPQNIVKYLQKVCFISNPHLNLKEYPFLEECLKDPKKLTTALENCKKRQAEAVKSMVGTGFTVKSPYDSSNQITRPYFQRKLEAALITLLKAPTHKDKLNLIDKLMPFLKKMCDAQFVKDMEQLKEILEKEKKEFGEGFDDIRFDNFIVEDTDAWDDMLLSGTEVAGSCQRISGDVKYNKCLLAYMRDGKNRAIVIKDPESGKIVARRIMRILIDVKTKKPVLFQEKLYCNPNVPARALQAIDIMFIKRARQLQIPLVRSQWEKSTFLTSQLEKAKVKLTSYPNPVTSKGSPAPHEYVDAGSLGIFEDGKFTIDSNHIQLVSS